MAIDVRVCAPDEVGRALDPIWHYFGRRATPEDVERFSTILPAERLEEVVAALRSAHPYEEPAYDVYPLV